MPSITLADDVAHPMAAGVPFDAEGTPKRRVELVRDGITTRAWSTTGAPRRRSAPSRPATPSPAAGAFGALPANLVLEPGGVSATSWSAGSSAGCS